MSLNAKIVIDDKLSRKLQEKEIKLDQVTEDVFQFFKSHTPIKTGNARKRTVLKNDTIVADYAYAKPLDQGRSKQAPDGMSKPTAAYFKKRIDAILGKK